ncbi:TIGR00303 family protein [Cyanobacterium aponinum UTEX 3221]|uniref:nicotinate mononucleotide-dependent phosphoribosyltransferase CobT n=1 Tax=Cyanobacterium aponinum TaxID=379064 RepID=UPI002B4BC8C4|nr:TIGR00303 family protein [Cyanobacterium aponinum]WRL37846.1 TIGR00303 family protein [Cyanobacterium aponinum UTEX 3221]
MMLFKNDIKIYTQLEQGKRWLNKYINCLPLFTCTLGFTNTALIEGISTAGATVDSRRYTALADAEFLVKGVQTKSIFPLPPLDVGISPTFISRAVVEKFNLPVIIFNAGLLQSPSVANIDLGGKSANCVSTGKALPLDTVKHLYQEGLKWGKILAQQTEDSYLILSECVVGGTTTALAVLTALGIEAQDKVNSSHPVCNHQQKWEIVSRGLKNSKYNFNDPLEIIAAVGDPMQIVVSAIALSASKTVGVMLAGGTQMLAIYALIKALNRYYNLETCLDNIIVGTTRWVAEDTTGDTVGLAQLIGDVSVCATQLNFSNSRFPSLQVYEQGFVKEGVGAGGSAIASHLLGMTKEELLSAIEKIILQF